MDRIQTAYAYARFSSDLQREESIDAQLRAIREYCQTNGIRILREFKDEAVSGRTANRPAFQQMFGILKEHPADLLIVHKLDRFARSRGDAAFYRSKLKEAGMRLVSVLERLDDSPESIIMEGILESMNEYYSANLSRECKKGIKENVLKGKRNGGKAPFGYTCIDQHLVPNADAPKLKEFFRMYSEGKRLVDIAKELDLPFVNYNAVLKNEVYLGTIISKEWRHENAHEPLVDRETWELCQRRMKNSPFNAANRALVPYLLSGMLICGNCGKTMHAVSSGRKYFYYSCQHKGCRKYKRDELEERVITEFAKNFVPTASVKARFYELVNRRVNTQSKEKEAEKTRTALQKRISRLLDSVQYAETPEDAKEIMAKVSELRRQMPPAQKEKQEIPKEVCDKFIDQFCNIQAHDYEQTKKILKKTIDKIVVKDEELFIYTMTLPPFCIIINKNGLK